MRERPIIFSAESVRNILAGSKSQTRRVVKFHKPWPDHGSWPHVYPTDDGGWTWTDAPVTGKLLRQMQVQPGKVCALGMVGDRFWVRETFVLQCDVDGDPPPFDDGRPILRAESEDDDYTWLQPHYKATDPEPELSCERLSCLRSDEPHCHWKSPITMPRWASRLTLEITAVRVERLQGITFEDCLDEGVIWTRHWQEVTCEELPDDLPRRPTREQLEALTDRRWEAYARAAFRRTWDELNLKRGFGWESKPWVWVISFRRFGGPEVNRG